MIGIDFSLNSPGMCYWDGQGYEFISFFNYNGRSLDKKILKAFRYNFELIEKKLIKGIIYDRKVNSKEFIQREQEKMADADEMAKMIGQEVNRCLSTDGKIFLEGFSYGSKGSSFIDIILYNAFMRKELLKNYKNITVFSPSQVKKLAGKGNANKLFMVRAFQDNYLQDKALEKNGFWIWMQNKKFDEKIPKPIDDLVDSYFILKKGLSTLEEKE